MKQQICNSKARVFFYSIFFAVFVLLQAPGLQAAGWGRTEEVIEYEGATWDGVYVDLKGLYFTALIPEYCGTAMQEGYVFVGAETHDGAEYLITTSCAKNFKPPKSLGQFVQMIQEAHPNRIVAAIDSKNFGAKYAVDIIPDNDEVDYWRFLSTKDRLIMMGTTDANENRRFNFFESIYIE